MMTGSTASTGDGHLVAALQEADEQVQRRLHARLAAAAAGAGILDVAYRTIDTPVGPLLLAATEQGLVRVAYDREDHDTVLAQLAGSRQPEGASCPGRAWTRPPGEVDEYFARRRRLFDLPLDFRLSHGFRRTVLTHLIEIGYGETASYAAVAVAAGSPKAVRAAATACATNPLPVVVPCHRVVRSGGAIGRYVGGTYAKKALLALEGAV